MIIRKMTASYGKLDGASLELKPGLNIISAPNESGKSSWCSFIKNMLYGVDSSAREKGGVKPDKLRYAPWSGAGMSGSMELEANGREITISRAGRESAPMREVSAVYTGTSEAVSNLREPIGETLLGISREVFERSAFIGQGGVAVSSSPELEKRIAAIVQTGDEGASYTDAEEKLRAAMRLRRYNKSGALPETERELDNARRQLQDIELEKQRGEGLRAARDNAVARRDALLGEVAAERETRRKSSLEALSESRKNIIGFEAALGAAQGAAAAAQGKLTGNMFGDCEPKAARRQTGDDMDEIKRLETEIASLLKKISRGRIDILTALTIGIICAGLVALDFMNVLNLKSPYFSILTSLATTGFVVPILEAIRIRKAKKLATRSSEQRRELYAKYACSSADEILAKLGEYEAAFNARRDAEAALTAAQERLTSEREKQRTLEASTLEKLDFSAGGEASRLTRALAEAEDALRRIREECAALEGRLSAMEGRDDIVQKINALTAEHKKLTLEYDALNLAADTLREAGTEIQNRLTPRLSARTGEIFARLTRGRYDSVALDRELKAMARLTDDTLARESAFLSVGALDQLYLAVRLAICELALPEDAVCPLVLDDALASFDDERCAAALEFLRELAREKQVLLFTCHGREAEMLGRFSDVNIINSF